MRKWPKFASVEQLQQTIRDVFDAGNKTVEIGYIESGHGMKGKKRWIFEDNDLEEMYEHYKGGREILMWCYDPKVDIPCSRKQRRASSEGSTKATTNSQVVNLLTRCSCIPWPGCRPICFILRHADHCNYYLILGPLESPNPLHLSHHANYGGDK